MRRAHTTADILREYPYLEAEDISATLSYAAWRAEEVEVTLGPLDALDEAVLARVRADGGVLVTHDLDFSATLAASCDDAPSVIQIRLQDLAASSVALEWLAL